MGDETEAYKNQLNGTEANTDSVSMRGDSALIAESTAQDANVTDLQARARVAKAEIEKFESNHSGGVEIFASTKQVLDDLERGQVPSKDKLDEVRRELQAAEAKVTDAQAKEDYKALMGTVGAVIPGSMAAVIGHGEIGQGLTLNGWGTKAQEPKEQQEEEQEAPVDFTLNVGGKRLVIPNLKNIPSLKDVKDLKDQVVDFGRDNFAPLRDEARTPPAGGPGGQPRNQGVTPPPR